MDKKIISIYMGNPDNSNHAELELPATPWEMVDAMDRLRLSEGQEPYWQVEDMGRYEFLAPHLDGYDLYQFITTATIFAGSTRTFSFMRWSVPTANPRRKMTYIGNTS